MLHKRKIDKLDDQNYKLLTLIDTVKQNEKKSRLETIFSDI